MISRETVFNAIHGFLDVVGDKADFSTRNFRGREQEGTDFLDNIAQGGVMGEECFFDGEKALFQGGIGRKLLSEADKSADDINAHSDGLGAVEDI